MVADDDLPFVDNDLEPRRLVPLDVLLALLVHVFLRLRIRSAVAKLKSKIAEQACDCKSRIMQRGSMEKEHFDTEAFFAALDGQREARGKTWKEVAAESGVSASTLTRMAQGKRPDVDGLGALLSWSGLKAEDFLAARAKAHRKPETLAMISRLLRADRNLRKDSAAAIEEIVKVAYKRFAEKE